MTRRENYILNSEIDNLGTKLNYQTFISREDEIYTEGKLAALQWFKSKVSGSGMDEFNEKEIF